MSSRTDNTKLDIKYLGTDIDDDGQDFAGAVDLAGDLVATAIVAPFSKVEALRVVVRITETPVGTTTTPVIKVWKNGTAGTLLATINLLATHTVGKTVYKDLLGVQLDGGDRVDFELDIKSVGGAIAGKGYFGMLVNETPESPVNVTAMIATT